MTLTPFEQTGKLTTFTAGVTYLQSLASASGGRMVMQQVGTSVEGRALWLVRLGATSAPAYTATPTAGLWVAVQHANEPQGWEGLIRRIRDLVEAPTAAELAYLTSHPMFLLPCMNPDNLGTSDPMNADGYNINRDHLSLVTPEGETIQRVLSVVQPQLVLDMHTGGALDMDVQSADATETDPAIVALSAVARDYLIDHLNGQGITSGPYPTLASEPRMLWTAAGLRGAVALLTEVRSSTGNPATDPTLASQIDWYMETVRALAVWHGANAADIASVQSVARLRAAGKGGSGETFRMGNTAPANIAAPAAYRLTREQAAEAADKLAVLGISISEDRRVTMSQPARSYIPYVLDGRAISAIVDALPLAPTIPGSASPTGRRTLHLGGRSHPVTRAGLVVDGVELLVP